MHLHFVSHFILCSLYTCELMT
ncbi:unnamed protein product, partial [Medioppia subpectinata]